MTDWKTNMGDNTETKSTKKKTGEVRIPLESFLTLVDQNKKLETIISSLKKIEKKLNGTGGDNATGGMLEDIIGGVLKDNPELAKFIK